MILAAKVFLNYVLEVEVADGDLEEVHPVLDSSGILYLPLHIFRRVSHFIAEKTWLRGF